MQQGGDVGGLADRAQMPEFQHGFKRESYPYLAFARKHNVDYGLVLALIDVWRKQNSVQYQSALESDAVTYFNHYQRRDMWRELLDVFEHEQDRQNAACLTAKV